MRSKTLLTAATAILISLCTVACPVCEKQQPKFLQGITHGAGPQSNWDYLIIAVITTIAVSTLFFSVKWLIAPGEKTESHIKHLILNME